MEPSLVVQAPGGPSPEAEMFEITAWSDLVAAAPRALVSAVGLEVASVGGARCVVAPGIPSLEFNRAVGLGVERPATDEDIDTVLSFYRQRDAKKAQIQIMTGAAPSDLAPRLVDRSCAATGRWVVVERRLAPVSVRAELDVRELGRAHAEESGHVFRVAYGLPPVFEAWNAGLVGRERWRTYGVFFEEKLSAVAYLYQHNPRAILIGAATLPEARGRGAQQALIRRRLADAQSAGATVAQTHTWLPDEAGRNPSLDNMHRAGFVDCHHRQNFAIR